MPKGKAIKSRAEWKFLAMHKPKIFKKMEKETDTKFEDLPEHVKKSSMVNDVLKASKI